MTRGFGGNSKAVPAAAKAVIRFMAFTARLKPPFQSKFKLSLKENPSERGVEESNDHAKS
jgi:hypothetical protein